MPIARSPKRTPASRCPASWFAFALAAVVILSGPTTSATAATGHGPHPAATVELDIKSDYSHIRVKKQASVRSLVFVRDNGDEVVETMVNLKRPHELLAAYSRFMFASYLWQPNPKQVLIVGLGGGAMVHFLQHYDPEVQVDAVEIDPEVVRIADRYFDTRTVGKTRIITDDGLHYLGEMKTQYDVVYMDAFLKPSRETDTTGVPLRLKTIELYQGIQRKLAPQGLVVFNLNGSEGINEDIETIRIAFPQVYVFRVHGGNYVVIGSMAKSRESIPSLHQRARDLDHRFKATFLFAELLNSLSR